MKNETNLFKRIRNIIVGNTLPKNEDLWIDTSNGEKKAVLKYKGNPLSGGGSGGSTGSTSGVIIQDGSITNNAPFRPATEVDVAKFTDGGVEVGQPVLEINGVVPHDLQFGSEGTNAGMFLLTSIDLTEHSAYYVQNGVASNSGEAHFIVMVFIVSDDATLLAPYQEHQ